MIADKVTLKRHTVRMGEAGPSPFVVSCFGSQTKGRGGGEADTFSVYYNIGRRGGCGRGVFFYTTRHRLTKHEISHSSKCDFGVGVV